LPIMALLLGLSSCKKDNTTEPTLNEPDYMILASATDNGVTLEIMAEDSFFVGYNRLYFRLKDDQGKQIKQATISLLPEMDMGTMQHGCPVENPAELANADNFDLFEGALIFQMGTMEMMDWKLDIDVTMDRSNHQFSFDPIHVKMLDEARVKVFTIPGGAKMVASWMFPMNPEVGYNDLGISVHKMTGPFDFSPVEDVVFDLEPWMPSMGHGSPGNVDPLHTELGHYEGIVNFTMGGPWEVRLDMYDQTGQTLLYDLFFDVTL